MDEDALFAEFLGEIKSVAVAPVADDDAASVGESEAPAAPGGGGEGGTDTAKRKGDAEVGQAIHGWPLAVGGRRQPANWYSTVVVVWQRGW